MSDCIALLYPFIITWGRNLVISLWGYKPRVVIVPWCSFLSEKAPISQNDDFQKFEFSQLSLRATPPPSRRPVRPPAKPVGSNYWVNWPRMLWWPCVYNFIVSGKPRFRQKKTKKLLNLISHNLSYSLNSQSYTSLHAWKCFRSSMCCGQLGHLEALLYNCYFTLKQMNVFDRFAINYLRFI